MNNLIKGVYHSGFNNGFNIAESVNFAFPDWLKYGINANIRYKFDKRISTFSYEELIYNIFKNKEYNENNIEFLKKDLNYFKIKEKYYMDKIKEKGDINIIKSEKLIIDNKININKTIIRSSNIKKENEICSVCAQDLFFSAVSCKCFKKFSCLSHFDQICDCCSPSDKFIMVKYSIDDIDNIINN
jgi:hypothetical protein